MDTATTAPKMELRALLALVRRGPDEAAAAAVTAFTGDINACPVTDHAVLRVAVNCGRPLTIAALAARGDCNPNIDAGFGVPLLCLLAGPHESQTDMATFLTHFPTVNVNACDLAGEAPLHYAALWEAREADVQVLLDAGADPTKRSLNELTPAQCAHQWGKQGCTKLLEAAEAWHNSLRRGWLCAVVGISENIAV